MQNRLANRDQVTWYLYFLWKCYGIARKAQIACIRNMVFQKIIWEGLLNETCWYQVQWRKDWENYSGRCRTEDSIFHNITSYRGERNGIIHSGCYRTEDSIFHNIIEVSGWSLLVARKSESLLWIENYVIVDYHFWRA